jgi:hypothetical protein
MRSRERTRGLLRAPKLAWDVLVRGRYGFVYDRMPMVAEGMSSAKRLNLFRAGANLLSRNLHTWSMPLHMQFELTNYCTLRCPVCPTGAGLVRRAAQAMDPALFEEPPAYLVVAFDGLTGETNSQYRSGARLAPILDGVRRLAVALASIESARRGVPVDLKGSGG